MPVLRCTNPECEEEWTVTSRLAIGSECPVCESETVEVMDDDDPPERQQVLTGPKRAAAEPEGGPRLAFARGAARKLLRDNKVVAPPIPVPALVRRLGLELEPRSTLAPLRARLRDSTIEYDKDAPPVALRFAFAHEIGHYCMGTTHESGPFVEEEANAYANELLVPGHMLHAALEQTKDEAELRQRFQVSGQVLEIAASVHQVAGRIIRS